MSGCQQILDAITPQPMNAPPTAFVTQLLSGRSVRADAVASIDTSRSSPQICGAEGMVSSA